MKLDRVRRSCAVMLLLVAATIASCAPEVAPGPAPTPTPTPTVTCSITLADALQLVDLASDFPATFEVLDAASEGIFLEPDCSEIQVYLEEHPLCFVTAYICIAESSLGQAAADSSMRNDADIYEAMRRRFEDDIVENGGYMGHFHGTVSHPAIGDMAVRMTGSGIADYVKHGTFDFFFDNLAFRRAEVLVFLEAYAYSEGDLISLDMYAQGIVERIDLLKS